MRLECIWAGALCGALRLEGASNLVENQINLAAGRIVISVPKTHAGLAGGPPVWNPQLKRREEKVAQQQREV